MGKMNLLKANWEGKVGQTVGAKWKDKSTIRTYSRPSNPRTPAQVAVRTVFADLTRFTALFSDQIKYLSALDTAGMSVRNAIIKLNKYMIESDDFNKANLLISKGGLQKVTDETATIAEGKVTVTWARPTATNFSADAKLIAVAVQETTGIVEVIEALATAETATGTINFDTTGSIDVYVYFLDKRGSNKVASLSDYIEITQP